MGLELILALLSMDHVASAYNIFILHPTPSLSHQLPMMALTEALIKRGHQLFVVSPNKVPGLEKNYTYVDLSFSYNFISDEKADDNETLHMQRQFSKWELPQMFKIYASMIPRQFKSEPFQKFLKLAHENHLSFDVSIIETFIAAHGVAMTRFLSGYKTPIVGITTSNGIYHGEDDLGSLLHLSYLPSAVNSYTDKMNLWEKIENWFSHLYIMPHLVDAMENSARAYFREAHGPATEALVDGSWSNLSVALVSSNSLYYYPRMLGPNIVELGPFHIKTPEKLSQNLQDWLDGAEKGVVYFNFGSNLKSKSLPTEVRNNLLKLFKELPPGYRVLWKWERDGKIPGQSDNILGQKWLPQQSILAHRKVKVFITQGGLQSFQEAVHYGVPMLVIPWFSDQEANAARIVDIQVGAQITPEELYSYDKLKSTFDAVLLDERYTKNMKKWSSISKDFTSQTIENAVFWIEHVAKHGHAHHLKPSTANTTYFQYFCLDILVTVLVVFTGSLYVLICLTKCLFSAVFSFSNSKIKTS